MFFFIMLLLGSTMSYAQQPPTDQTIEIRPARLGDENYLADLLTQLGYPATQAQMRKRIEQWSQPDSLNRIFIAEQYDTIIGLLGLSISYFFHTDQPVARITSLVVDQNHQGQGVGKLLLIAAEEHARVQGCYKVELTSGTQRTDAHRFYIKQGYATDHKKYFAKNFAAE